MTEPTSSPLKSTGASIEFVLESTSIQDAVKQMVESRVGSLLVVDKADRVVGIVTERDIVRKVALLDLEGKMSRKVNTIMSRPVRFVRVGSLRADASRLHRLENLRHFPVLSDDATDEPTRADVLGMVSVTDFFRESLLREVNPKPASETTEKKSLPLVILAHKDVAGNSYSALFKGVGFAPYLVDDLNKVIQAGKNPPLLFDLDGFPQKDLQQLIPLVAKYPARAVLCTSNPNLIPLFRKYLDPNRRHVALKPVDVTYCAWFLTQAPGQNS